ncbi:MAG TPA: universal stress protein [Sporichthyaceae bacterium]|jgi:nucleotide-binding universal stress UspA family protein
MSEGWVAELGTDGPTVILAAVDGSTTSLRAGAYAAGLARRQGSRLVVGHVVHPSAVMEAQAATAIAQAAHEVAAELETEVRAAVSRLGIPVDFRLAHGAPYAELVAMADAVGAELVVVGASASAGHRVVGALGARLVRAGRWPVVVVP